MPPSMSRVSPTPSSTSVARGRCILVLHHHHPNGTKRQQLAKHRPQSSMPAPKRRHTRKGGNELTLSTDLATECSTARRSIASLYFTLSIRGREGRKSFSGVNLNGRGLVGMLGVIGTEEDIPCDVRLPAWTPIQFSPLKAVWLQNRLAFDITAARPVPMYPHFARRCER